MKLELEIDFKKLGEELAKHDFVQVVRCRDCEYYVEPFNENCDGFCKVSGTLHWKTFYCGNGERRSNDADND